MSLSHCIHQTLNSKASTRFHSGGLQQSLTLILNTFLFGVIILIANILKRAFSSQLAAKLRNRLQDIDRKSGSAGMPRPISYAVFCLKKKNNRSVRCSALNVIRSNGAGGVDSASAK